MYSSKQQDAVDIGIERIIEVIANTPGLPFVESISAREGPQWRMAVSEFSHQFTSALFFRGLLILGTPLSISHSFSRRDNSSACHGGGSDSSPVSDMESQRRSINASFQFAVISPISGTGLPMAAKLDLDTPPRQRLDAGIRSQARRQAWPGRGPALCRHRHLAFWRQEGPIARLDREHPERCLA